MRDLFAIAVLLLACTGTSAAQSLRLNAPFAPDHIGAMQSFVIGPGSRVVYAADQDVQGSIELFDAPIDGSAPPIRLAAPGMTVTAGLVMRVSADGQWLVYVTDAFGGLPERFPHLYRVPMGGGGSAVELSGTLVAGGKVMEFGAGAMYAVYRADALVDERYELFSVPLDGSSAAVRLHGALVAGGDVAGFAMSPDGSRVVYQADASVDGTFETFSAPADGSAAPVRLHPVLSAGQDMGYLGEPFSPDSSRVLLVGNLDTAGAAELYVAPSDGSAAPLRLNPAFPGGRAVTAYSICPLSDRVVYLADQDADEVLELYSVPLDGGTAVKLNGALVPGGDVHPSFQIAPDGSSVAYKADELLNDRFDLFGVPIDGSAPRVQVNGPLLPNASVISPLAFSPDGSRVVYYADEEPGFGPELRSAPIDASGGDIRLSAPPAADEEPFGMVICDDGRVLYELAQITCFDPELCVQDVDLYSVPIDGSQAPVQLSTIEGNEVDGTAVDAASGRVAFLFLRSQDPLTFTSARELYSVPTDGGEAPLRLHPELALGGSERDVANFQHTPDGEWVLYTADQDTNGVLELYRVSADGTGPRVKLNGPVSLLGVVPTFTISPDGEWVVYKPSGGAEPLFSVHIDDAALPVALGTAQASSSVRISPDGTRVVYEEHATNSIYCVPIDGSASPVSLVTFAPGRGLAGFSVTLPDGITPDSSRFVYVADADTDESFELYSVPLDGSAAPVKLSGSMVAGGDVVFTSGSALFRISPDASRVLYVADAAADNVAELYSVPIDGSAPPVRLNGTLVTGGDVATDYRISPDSTSVVYRADELLNETFEIFRVPLDGSAAPVRLNDALPVGGDVAPGNGPGFLISPDSSRVVYRADQVQNERFELFSVPLDGSAAPTKISGTLIALGDVDFVPFQITVDGARVVYTADATIDEHPDLFAVPIDGSAAPTKLNGQHRVNDYELCPDGAGLVYRPNTFPLGGSQLYFVALDGSVRCNVSHVPLTTSVAAYSIHPDSGSVVYKAARVPFVDELWRSTFTRWPRTIRRAF